MLHLQCTAVALAQYRTHHPQCVCVYVISFSSGATHGYPSVTLHTVARVRACWDTCIRFGVLENDEGQGEVTLGQADQVFSKQTSGSTLSLSLTAM